MTEQRKEVEKLITGYSSLAKNMCNIIRYPDINKYNNTQLLKFLKTQNFTEKEIENLKTCNDRNLAFKKIREERNKRDAFAICAIYSKFIDENKLFIDPETKDQFEAMNDILWNNWVDKTYAEQ